VPGKAIAAASSSRPPAVETVCSGAVSTRTLLTTLDEYGFSMGSLKPRGEVET